MNTHEYNRDSAEKYDWTPEWFGGTDFNMNLASKIAAFQDEHGLKPDGMCGPATYRRAFLKRESDIDEYKPSKIRSRNGNAIVCNGNFVPIRWSKVVLWSEPEGFQASKSNYRERVGESRDIKQFVSHWDVCITSQSCFKVLERRGISVHFLIDYDGTIYQTMDTQHVAHHAGGKNLNEWSVGVEINNPYYLKYNKWYEDRDIGPRPIVKDAIVHGEKLDPFLGFYFAQRGALLALMRAIHKGLGVPLQCPMEDGEMSTNGSAEAWRGDFKGFVHHYHLKREKIDCAGLDLASFMETLNNEL